MNKSAIVLAIAATIVGIGDRSEAKIRVKTPPPKEIVFDSRLKLDLTNIYPAAGNPRNNEDTSLAIMFHGFMSGRGFFGDIKSGIDGRSLKTSEWDYDWSGNSNGIGSPTSLDAPGAAHGRAAAYIVWLWVDGGAKYENIHILSHSAGVFPSEAMARNLHGVLPDLRIQQTFLDAFTPHSSENWVGQSADAADSYIDVESIAGVPWLLSTNDFLPFAANFDVTAYNKGSNAAVEGHEYPAAWYAGTITGDAGQKIPKSDYDLFGYGFSKMVADGADDLEGFPKEWPSPRFREAFNRKQALAPDEDGTHFRAAAAQEPTVGSGLKRAWGGRITTGQLCPPAEGLGASVSGDPNYNGDVTAEDTPTGIQLTLSDSTPRLADDSDFAWVTLDVPNDVDDPMPLDFVTFDYQFLTPTAPDFLADEVGGILSVWAADPQLSQEWNLMDMYEERTVIGHGDLHNTMQIALPGWEMDQNFLAFRFDAIDLASSIQISNLQFGRYEPTVFVPESASAVLMALGLAGLLPVRRRRS